MYTPSFTLRKFQQGSEILWRVLIEQYHGAPREIGPVFPDRTSAERYARRSGLRAPLESALLAAVAP